MKTNRWDDASVDTRLFLLLQDLTSLLTGPYNFAFSYKSGAFIDLQKREVSGSSFWDVRDPSTRESGYKTDVFLRTIGSMRHSGIPALQAYVDQPDRPLPKFTDQLVALLEDIRLEEKVRAIRPGTKKDFHIRTQAMKHYFTTQLETNVTRGYPLDELFCLIYLLLFTDGPEPDFPAATKKQKALLEDIKPLVFDGFSAKNTAEITQIAGRIAYRLDNRYADMMRDYMAFPIKDVEAFTEQTLLDELTRTDPLANEDREEVDEDDQEYYDQSFSAWHRENENSDRKQNFLQFELDVGTQTTIKGGDTRETEAGDQAMGMVQGSSGQKSGNDYSETDNLDKDATDKGDVATAGSLYGEANKYAVEMTRYATEPSGEADKLYQQYATEIDPYRRRLANTIEKTLEHKRNEPARNLLMGRLSKNLLPLVIDDNPRIFYKKSLESNEMDAVFTLLVDCSASMHNKMEETKRGIVLFHEVLDQLHIPHSIVGFWEDAMDGSAYYQLNYFHHVQEFDESPYAHSGAKIMQLEAEEDNRDGFSIRVMTRELLRRREKNKFLLVFTDGEPAAFNYDDNGIVDTNVAVAEAQKQGIDVIGMFLADGEIDEQEATMMQNIYGKKRLMIPSVSELPEHFAPLLKRLLLQGM